MRKATMLTLLLLLFSVAGLTQAQDVSAMCGQLSEADCELLTQAQRALGDLSSYGMTISGHLSLSNIPNLTGSTFISVTGTGSVSGDLSQLYMSESDTRALSADPDAMMRYLADVMDDVSAQAALTFALSENLVEQSDGALPSTIPFNVRLVDGTAYLDFTALRTALGQQGANLPSGWYGIDMPAVIERIMAMNEGMAQAASPDMISRLTDADLVGKFVRVERLDDTTTPDGTAVASFHSVLDYKGLFSDPEMQDLMIKSMREQGETLSDAEMKEVMNLLQQIFNGVTLEVFQTVGLDDQLPRSTQFTLNWSLQPMVDAMVEAGAGDMGFGGTAPIINLNFVVNYHDFDAVEDITAPEGAMIVPLDALMGGMSAMPPGAQAEAAEMTPTPQG